jgi:hypothetical protein
MQEMWELRRFTTLRASMAWYRDNLTFSIATTFENTCMFVEVIFSVKNWFKPASDFGIRCERL